MGKKNDWQKLAESDDLMAVGASPHRGRGWKVFSGLLFVGTAAFALAFYLPLTRAHSKLRDEYANTSKQATTFRQQLTDTVATLNHTTEECDKMRTELRSQNKQTEDLAQRAERIERSLQSSLKKFLGKGKLSLERQKEVVRVELAAQAAAAPTGGDLTDFGKKALCAVGSSLKDTNARIEVQGLGAANDKTGGEWQLAAARAGNAAQQLIKNCGIEPSKLSISVGGKQNGVSGSGLGLEIKPSS